MLGENFNQDPSQRITYDIQVNAGQVDSTLQRIDERAKAVADSMAALSSGYLNRVQDLATMGSNGPMPGQTPLGGGMLAAGMIPQTMMAAQQATAMGGAFSPQAIMARDSMMMQLRAMGPSNGLGPALTTPWGDPTVNFTRSQAGPGRMNYGYLPFLGPPGAPGDPRRGDFFFSDRQGSALDTAGIMAGRMMGFGIANDNLEDRMVRNIERRMSYLGENVSGMMRFGALEMAPSVAGAALGSMFGPVGGIAGGLVGAAGGAIADQTFGRVTQPFVDMGKDFKQYTAPFIKGTRLGGGISERERFEVQNEIAKKVASDNWFTAREYQDLIGMAGETGQFQFTGSKEQALKAVENIGATTKALLALGVKSREMLGEIDRMSGTFGMSPGKDPAQVANFYATMAVSAQSAGMSTAQMSQAVAPAAQMFANQGLGFASGARIAAMNLGVSGELFRSGRLGAFENAYYGGKEGFANSLTQAQAASMRTPVGETFLMGLFGDNFRNLNRMLSGETLSLEDHMRGAGRLASANPGEFMGIRAMMPRLLQNVPGEFLALGDMRGIIGEYQQLYGKKGPVNSLELLNYMISARQMDPTSANAMLDFAVGAGDAAAGIRRSAREQMEIQRMEGLRAPGLQRRVENWYERNIARPFTGFRTWMDLAGNDVGKSVNEALTGVHIYEQGADATRVFAPFEMEMRQQRAIESVRAIGLTPISDLTDKPAEVGLNEAVESTAKGLLGGNNPAAMERFEQALGRSNISADDARLFRQIVTDGSATMGVQGRDRQALDRAALDVTGERDAGAAQARLLQDAEMRQRFEARVGRDGYQAPLVEAYLKGGQVVVSRDQLPTSLRDQMGMVLAEAAERRATARLLDPGQQEVINRMADYDQAGFQRASGQLREMGFSQAEIDTFRQVTYEDSISVGLDQINPFSSRRSRGLRYTDEMAEGESRTLRRAQLSPERFQTMLKVYDREIRQKQEDFQAANLDFTRGVQAAQDGTDELLGGMAGDVVRQLRQRGDMGAVEGAITDDRQQTIENLSRVVFQRDYKDLTNAQRYQLGGVTSQLTKERLDGQKRSQLTDLTEGATRDPGDPRMMTLENVTKRIKDLSGQLGDVGASVLGGEADQAIAGGNIYLRRAVADIISRSRGYTDAAAKLEGLGVTEDKYAEYGIDAAAFRDKGSRYGLEYQQNVVNKAIGELQTKDPALAKKLAGMDGDFDTMFPDPEGGFRKAKELIQLQQRQIDLQPKSISEQDIKDLSVRFGTDRVGGVSAFGVGAGGMTWKDIADKLGTGDVKDTRTVMEALMADDNVKGRLNQQAMDQLVKMSGKLEEGGALSDDDLLSVVKQVLPDKTLKDIQLLREARKGAGKTDAQIGTEVLNQTLTQALTGGMQPHATVGERAGSTLDPEVRQAMLSAFNQQQALADQMQQLAGMVDPTRQQELLAGINKLAEGFGATGTGGGMAEKFGEALAEYARPSGGQALNVRIVDGQVAPPQVRQVQGDSNQNKAAPQPAALKDGGVQPKGAPGPGGPPKGGPAAAPPSQAGAKMPPRKQPMTKPPKR